MTVDSTAVKNAVIVDGDVSATMTLFDAEDMCRELKGIAPTTLHLLTEQRQVLSIPTEDGGLGYPTFQVFDGTLNPRLSEVLMRSTYPESDSVGVASWLNTLMGEENDPNGILREYYGLSPLSLLTVPRDVFDYQAFWLLKDFVTQTQIRVAAPTTTE